MRSAVRSAPMTRTMGLLLALVLLALAGCAPPVAGGVWRLGPYTRGQGFAGDITMEFVDGDTVRVSAVQGGLRGCPAVDRSFDGRWFVNSAGQVVVVSTCDIEIPCPMGGSFNICSLFETTASGAFVFEGENRLVSRGRDPQVAFQRR